MSLQTLDDPEKPTARGALANVLSAVLALTAIVVVGAWWLLRDGATPHRSPSAVTAEQTVIVPLEVTTGQGNGSPAALQDELARIEAATSAPYVIYLVANTGQRNAMTAMGLADGEMVVVAGTLDERAAAQAHIELLERNLSMPPDARAVEVVDLRQPPVTHATESSLQLAPDDVSDQGRSSQRQTIKLAPEDDASRPRPTAVVQSVYLVRSPEQADSVRQAIDEADAIRDTLGQPPLTAAVLMVDAEDERVVRALLEESDAIRGRLGLPRLTVVDLRST